MAIPSSSSSSFPQVLSELELVAKGYSFSGKEPVTRCLTQNSDLINSMLQDESWRWPVLETVECYFTALSPILFFSNISPTRQEDLNNKLMQRTLESCLHEGLQKEGPLLKHLVTHGFSMPRNCCDPDVDFLNNRGRHRSIEDACLDPYYREATESLFNIYVLAQQHQPELFLEISARKIGTITIREFLPLAYQNPQLKQAMDQIANEGDIPSTPGEFELELRNVVNEPHLINNVMHRFCIAQVEDLLN